MMHMPNYTTTYMNRMNSRSLKRTEGWIPSLQYPHHPFLPFMHLIPCWARRLHRLPLISVFASIRSFFNLFSLIALFFYPPSKFHLRGTCFILDMRRYFVMGLKIMFFEESCLYCFEDLRFR
ncbi:uncharacterized protein BO96DRAFT_42748 [Aspergillus niger CBS 101883]|uniref:Uncharacterized protein n=1 Tax=Aspergillus niger ATCC 13496 TaxID=1353008 RepID=A0A370C408_ASPNG|nr:uncharacterized protein BO96DRAFT_42748 [Aspergillus niger CBS 101883]PYH56900.1 hypothetical protein BO96DRAFT_42748 [Aspergillus niger CBS 101883]RDH22618.1 hypothetical protein M747DRAFT_181111 [Aspergillus niger ATCC 13496]